MICPRRIWRGAAAIVATLACATALSAQTSEEAVDKAALDCSNPAQQGGHACVFPEGQVTIESTFADRTIDHAGGIQTTSTLLGDTLVHVGVAHGLEAQLGWDIYDRERTRFAAPGRTLRSAGIGDVTIGGKLAILSAAEGPVAVAIQPTLSIPVGNLALGGAQLGGSVVVPVSYDLSDTLTLDLTPEAEFTGNRADSRKHLEYGATVGVDRSFGDRLSATLEYSLIRDRDPAFHRTRQMAGLSLSQLIGHRLELNAGVSAGLNAQSPRCELQVGITRHLL